MDKDLLSAYLRVNVLRIDLPEGGWSDVHEMDDEMDGAFPAQYPQ